MVSSSNNNNSSATTAPVFEEEKEGREGGEIQDGDRRIIHVNPCVTCRLCNGYFVDAATIVECLHSFCRSCIIRHFVISSKCPVCGVFIPGSTPEAYLRPDLTLQEIVYKIVPGLFREEMRRRREFYARATCDPKRPLNPAYIHGLSFEERGDIANVERLIFYPTDLFSISLEYCPKDMTEHMSMIRRPPTATPVASQGKRFLRCPGQFTVRLLKKFLRAKFDIINKDAIELMYRRDFLLDEYTMMDLAYIYMWQANEPLRLSYIFVEEITPLLDRLKVALEKNHKSIVLNVSPTTQTELLSSEPGSRDDRPFSTILPPLVQLANLNVQQRSAANNNNNDQRVSTPRDHHQRVTPDTVSVSTTTGSVVVSSATTTTSTVEGRLSDVNSSISNAGGDNNNVSVRQPCSALNNNNNTARIDGDSNNGDNSDKDVTKHKSGRNSFPGAFLQRSLSPPPQLLVSPLGNVNNSSSENNKATSRYSTSETVTSTTTTTASRVSATTKCRVVCSSNSVVEGDSHTASSTPVSDLLRIGDSSDLSTDEIKKRVNGGSLPKREPQVHAPVVLSSVSTLKRVREEMERSDFSGSVSTASESSNDSDYDPIKRLSSLVPVVPSPKPSPLTSLAKRVRLPSSPLPNGVPRRLPPMGSLRNSGVSVILARNAARKTTTSSQPQQEQQPQMPDIANGGTQPS